MLLLYWTGSTGATT